MGNNFWFAQSSFNKEHQKKSPIQIPYHIKVCLQEYYKNFGEWPIPDFSDKCLICGGVNCASYHGYYTRTAICPLTGFSVPDLPVLRFLCHDKGNARTCDHVTFSLLPLQLVPFRQLSLNFMLLAVWILISRHLSLTRAMDVIERELNNLSDVADCINISTMMSWKRMILAAFELFLSADINMVSNSRYEQLLDTAGIQLFLKTFIHYQCQINNYPIRGPDAFAWDFYQQSGGADQCAPFLFGRASQHRR